MENKKTLSDILKWILATNYFYNIIDQIKDTQFYSQKLKNLVNQLETEMNNLQKKQGVIDFYKLANQKMYLNNEELHKAFFDKLTKIPVMELEKFMIDFLENK